MDIAQQHFERGKALAAINRHKEALEEYFKCLGYEPNSSPAFWQIAFSYMKLNDYQNSVLFIDKYIANNPQSADAFFVKAIVLRGGEEADRAIDEAITLNPNNSKYWALKASFYDSDEDRLFYAEKGLSIDPNDVSCLNRKIEALSQLYRTKEAKAAIEIVLSIDPNNPHVHHVVGKSHLINEKTEIAETHFKEALRISPNLVDAEKGLKQAKKNSKRNIVVGFVSVITIIGLIYWLVSWLLKLIF